jgi:cell division protein FtsZ
MEKRGNALIGIGIGMGEERAIEAAKQAVSSPLLETSIAGATDAIINVTGGNSLTLFEAEQAAEVVRAAANTDINTIFGAVINENLTDEVIVTVIATGFENNSEPLYNTIANNRRNTTIDEEVDSELDIPPFLRSGKF